MTEFVNALEEELEGKVRGYALGVRHAGNLVASLASGWARTPTDGGVAWTLDTRMHVASVSKLVTAMAAVRMLHESSLSYDTKIGPYLPTYWTVGANSADITFRQLMTHTAGFNVPDHYNGDFPTFKDQIADGVPLLPAMPVYTNGAYSLIRVLNSIFTGARSRDDYYTFLGQRNPTYNNSAWDLGTSNDFIAYANSKVYRPAGVSTVSVSPTATGALAYSSAADDQGWDSGNLKSQVGGVGFRLSVNDLLELMGAFRRQGSIVPATVAQGALDAGFGVNFKENLVRDGVNLGSGYPRRGLWAQNLENGHYHVEQALAYFLPEDYEVVVLVNSNIGPEEANLLELVRTAYLNHYE